MIEAARRGGGTVVYRYPKPGSTIAETATILTFPKRSVPEDTLSVEGDLAQLWRVQLTCATTLRDCAAAIEDSALALMNMTMNASRH